MNSKIDQFRIVINMRVADGFMETGNLFIGSDKDAAIKLFSELEGKSDVSTSSLLRLDLKEHAEGMDVLWHSLECSLSEMGDNMKMITKETFRLLNLE
ncbi:MAG: hypothetical protein ABI378_07240 [Chitinophagaceae bacterium]